MLELNIHSWLKGERDCRFARSNESVLSHQRMSMLECSHHFPNSTMPNLLDVMKKGVCPCCSYRSNRPQEHCSGAGKVVSDSLTMPSEASAQSIIKRVPSLGYCMLESGTAQCDLQVITYQSHFQRLHPVFASHGPGAKLAKFSLELTGQSIDCCRSMSPQPRVRQFCCRARKASFCQFGVSRARNMTRRVYVLGGGR